MASPTNIQFLDVRTPRGNEGRFLTYLACRIDREVRRFQRGEEEALIQGCIKKLAELALEVLGSKDEVEVWLEAATRATELPKESGHLLGRTERSNPRSLCYYRLDVQPPEECVS